MPDSAQPALRNETQVIAAHQQKEQGERKSHANGEHFDGALGLSLVLDQVVERAGEAGQDEDDEKQGNNSHEQEYPSKFQSNPNGLLMHLLRLRAGSWRFAPTVWPTLAALFFFVLTLFLGNWQSGRAETKRALQARYDLAVREAPVHVGNALLDQESVLYRKLEVVGTFDDAHTILIDNRVLDGVAGYHVLTPLQIGGGPLAILVNRGWVATGRSREQLPVPPTPIGSVRLEGMAVDPRTRYVELASITPQGRVWQNLDFDRYVAATGLRLQPVLLLQTSPADDGLQRAWPRPDTGVDTHVGYAFQWYSLAATLAVLWLIMNIKRSRPDGDGSMP